MEEKDSVRKRKNSRAHFIIPIMESSEANNNIMHCARVDRTGFLRERLQIKKQKQCDGKNGKKKTE